MAVEVLRETAASVDGTYWTYLVGQIYHENTRPAMPQSLQVQAVSEGWALPVLEPDRAKKLAKPKSS